jgi:hypothetical protein
MLPTNVDLQAAAVDVAEDERNPLHFCSESRNVCLDVVIHTEPSKELMEYRERSISCWNADMC